MKNYYNIGSKEIVFRANDNPDLATRVRVTTKEGKYIKGVTALVFQDNDSFSEFIKNINTVDLGFEINEDK